MLSVSFPWVHHSLFWGKGSELSGRTAQMSSLFRAKEGGPLSEEAPASAAPAHLPLGNKGLTKPVLSMESGFGPLSGTSRWTSGGPRAPESTGELHLCAGEVETGSKGVSGQRGQKC